MAEMRVNMSSIIDWSKCIICQRGKSNEKLTCPVKSKQVNARDVYLNFIQNVDEFNRVCENSKKLDLTCLDEGDGTLETLCHKNAKWHPSCRNRFNKLKIERERENAAKKANEQQYAQSCSQETTEASEARRSERTANLASPAPDKRTQLEKNRTTCLFCNNGAGKQKLHRVSTFQFQDKLKTIATELNDTNILPLFSLGDFVAQERAYHATCYSSYITPFTRTAGKRPPDDDEKNESLAYIELALFMEESEKTTFKLSDLMKMFKDIYFDIAGVVFKKYLHSTRFSERLILLMPNLRKLETSKENYVVFDKGVRSFYSEGIQDMDDESVVLWRAAKLIRKDIALFKDNRPKTNLNKFEDQETSVPSSLLTLSQMILTGGSKLKRNNPRFQESVTVSQVIFTNTIAHRKEEATHKRYHASKETPLFLYIGALLYQTTRSQSLIDTLFSLGLCVSYKRVINLYEDIAEAVTQHFEKQGVMCPPSMRKNVFITAAVDNIDHNPTSSTAHRSFHGTGLSFFQHPTDQNTAPSELVHTGPSDIKTDCVLQNFLNVNTEMAFVYKDPQPVSHQGNIESDASVINQAVKESQAWLEAVELDIYSEDASETLMWSAFHARKSEDNRLQSTSTMLPLLDASSLNAGTIKHTMNTIQEVTSFLNPGQISVMAADQPIYLICKEIQWAYPEEYGPDKFFLLMGGLHIEFEIMKVLGTLLENSGWTFIISKAGLCGSGTADSMLKAKDLKKTRYAYQVTAACLWILQRESYQSYVDSTEEPLDFTEWRQSKTESSSHFFFWNLIFEQIQVLLAFLLSERSANFDMYVEMLKCIVPLLFALDKHRYAKCLSVHIHDILTIKSKNPLLYEQISRNFTVRKSDRPFSCMATDHAHEQNNETAKGSLSVISLMDTPHTLNRWMLASPHVQVLLNDFASDITNVKQTITQKHLDDTKAKNSKLFKDVSRMAALFQEIGNPFCDTNTLHNIETGEQPPNEVVTDLRRMHELGKRQYKEYFQQRLELSNKSMKDTLHKNNIKLLSYKPKTVVKKSKAKMLRTDYGLFANLLMSCQTRNQDLDDFFMHENHPFPPSLTDSTNMRITTSKADLVPCLTEGIDLTRFEAQKATCVIVDAAFLIQATRPSPRMTFSQYAEIKLFRLIQILSDTFASTRIDVVFDRYLQSSIKEAARIKRGTSCERIIRPDMEVPKNWNGFLANSKNKEQLFKLLAETIVSCQSEKEVIATHEETTISNSAYHNKQIYSKCNHEEADTRMILHARQAADAGHANLVIRSSDTDVLVLAVAHFENIGADKLWIYSGTSKHHKIIPVHEVFKSLGPSRSAGLPFFHSFSGCDTTSCFTNYGKKTHWLIANSSDEFWPTFAFLSKQPQTISQETMDIVEKYTVLVYDKLSRETKVNVARRSLVARGRTIDRIPPTKDALILHTRRAAYQAGHIWGNAIIPSPEIPQVTEWGWKLDNSRLLPVWTLLPEAAKACRHFIKCKCKEICKNRCSCLTAGLQCTELCSCKGDCDRSMDVDGEQPIDQDGGDVQMQEQI